jgi:acetyl-CoA acetyltransferase
MEPLAPRFVAVAIAEECYGPVQDALAKLAVTQREHALLNDNACAKLRKPLTAEEYLSARQISSPINLLDCVMSCDGANAVLVTSRREAGALGARAVRIREAVEAFEAV